MTVIGACALDIKFNTGSARLHSWIKETVDSAEAKGINRSRFCADIAYSMNANHGKFWGCIVKPQSFLFFYADGADSATEFELDNTTYIVWKSPQ